MTIINSVLASVPEAIAAFKTGETVIIVDDETRENEGDLAIAGEFVTPEAVNFFAREGRGTIKGRLNRSIRAGAMEKQMRPR
ncbi:MAG: 3,4-dihydroxy-2-butanone-4-phosphate synthase, partial [Pseudomonadota bacterium]